jgi:hypothetical protein
VLRRIWLNVARNGIFELPAIVGQEAVECLLRMSAPPRERPNYRMASVRRFVPAAADFLRCNNFGNGSAARPLKRYAAKSIRTVQLLAAQPFGFA